MQKVRRHPFPCGHRASTACKCLVSGTVSLPLPGFFSFFAHATSSLSVVEEYLALGGGPPCFKPGFPCLALLGKNDRQSAIFRLRGYHPLWRNFPGPLARSRIYHCRSGLQTRDTPPTTPAAKRLQACRQPVWAVFPLRSPLLRKSSFLSLPEDTEMFQFSSFAFATYGFSREYRVMSPVRFRIRRSAGQCLVGGSPQLNAAVPRPSSPLNAKTSPRHP